MLSEVAELQAVQVGGVPAHGVVPQPHRVGPDPQEQPLQLAVTVQRLRGQVAAGRNARLAITIPDACVAW